MIDPDSIVVQQHNTNNTLTFNDVPEYDYYTYDLEDDKQLKKFFKNIEMEVRSSFEYRQMIKYLKDYMGMDSCSFIQVSSRDNFNIRIEIHHYPFSLYDIVTIVYGKRIYYNESLEVQQVAKEVTMLHYKLLIGLIPLSKTVHQLTHAGKLFIPIQNVLGRYKLFIDFYKPFCSEEQLDTISRIEKYSEEQVSDLLNTQRILEQNNISIYNNSPQYQLPDFDNLNTSLDDRIQDIKNNHYQLPGPAAGAEKGGIKGELIEKDLAHSLRSTGSIDLDQNSNIRSSDTINKSKTSPFFFSKKE